MDGYAVRAENTPGTLRVVGEQPAGRIRNLEVRAGEAVRIFTGACLPNGANAVVMQEDVTVENDHVRISDRIEVGEFVRHTGGDICAGQEILRTGDPITPARLALLTACGIESILVHPLPRIGILTTGDEVRPMGTPLQPGEIHDSNGPMLTALLAPHGRIVATKHAPDDPAAVADTLSAWQAETDVVVISAGVSVGDHDPVRVAIDSIGAHVNFWTVAVKPGKPLLLAKAGGQTIFGLPGNPVSTYVTALLFVIPALLRLAGAPLHLARPKFDTLPIGVDLENPDARPHYLRVRIESGHAVPVGTQASHGLSGLARCDALIRLPENSRHPAGTLLPALRLT